ncbi:hypothetical protein [Rhodoferax sp.]|uniref:hypothetical protein n=1 Tax=Rhodoferax sp. TaxID=50421 RepID=UPI002637981A|nr:hypothetical protein [Rhodoferax sp.]MDD2920235.1 hypothetical protein [Rhodoferax sp.]
MATETLSRNEIDNACRTLAVKTLSIDVEKYHQAITKVTDCIEAIDMLAYRLKGDRGMSMLLRSVNENLGPAAFDLRATGKALGIELESV